MRTKFTLRSLLTACALACAALVTQPAFGQGQTTSAIRGDVVDDNGNGISQAQVQVTHLPTNTVYETTTGGSGRFNLGGLRVGGPYRILVQADGYQTVVESGVNLELQQTFRPRLQMNSTEEVVELEAFEVTAGPQTIFDSGAIGAGSVLDNTAVVSAPSINETISDLVRLSPLVVIGDTERLEINAAGQHYRQNSVQIDGVNINDQFGLESTGLPSLFNPVSMRTVEQLNVVVSEYDVRNSGFTGASVNAVTKSGTNRFEGEAYVYYSDDSLRADNPASGVSEPFDEMTYGLSLGGPILKDRLFFYLNYEKFEQTITADDPGFIPDPTAVQQVRDFLLNLSAGDYPNGYDPGTWGEISGVDREDEKYFAKLDWNITDDHRFSVRYSQTEAINPDFGEYTDFRETSLTSHFFEEQYKNTAFAAQLNSRWSDNFETEIIVARDTFDKTPTYLSDDLFPEIQIRNFPGTDLSGNPISNGELFFGSEDSRQANDLGTETTKGKAIGTYYLGEHTLTFGVDYEKTEFDNLFLQDVYGDITFRDGGLDQFIMGETVPGFRISRATGVAGEEIAAQSDYSDLGFFAQDRWSVNRQLEVLFGVRIDAFSTSKNPAENVTFNENFVSYDGRTNFDNTETIDGETQIGVRLGFRYDLDTETDFQIRGGIGLFQGRVPGVYLSNAFSNNGVTTGRLAYSDLYPDGITLEQYLNDEFDANDPIIYQDTPSGSQVDLIDRDFELPSVWRGNLAFDRKIGASDWILTMEYVHTITNKGVYVENLNLDRVGTSPDGRDLFAGSPFFGNTFDPNYSDVYNLKNTDKGEAQNFVVSVRRPLIDNWFFSASYTHGNSEDVSSVTSSTAFSNFVNRAVFNQNEDVAARSNYEVTSRILVNLGYEIEWSERTQTLISLVYEGRSGRPYSFVFAEDFNNDGGDDNDLLYIPTGPNDPLIGFEAGTSAGEIDAFFSFLEQNNLTQYAGGAVPRNTGTSPWIDRVDLRIAQDIELGGNAKLELFVNIINFANLLNDDWGLVHEVEFPFTAPVAEGRIDGGQIIYDLDGGPSTPELQTARSRYQIRLGATLKF